MFNGRFMVSGAASLARSIVSQNKINFFIPASQLCTKSTNNVEFKQIYRLPIISVGSTLNKIKKFQLIGSGIAIPGSIVASFLNLCDMETATTISSMGVISTSVVFLIGQFFSNMIGFVYLSPNLQTVRFSYSDFWGNRQDVDFPREELIPLTNSAQFPTDIFYSKVYRYSVTKPYKIILKGEILNTEAFTYIFKHNPD